MTDQALYDKILAFDIDGQAVQFGFAQRLSREARWTLSYSNRAIREYRRFVYLATTYPDFAVPSEAVDLAWRLHLTDSKSYWDRFVPEVLETPLHHEPNKGGVEVDDPHVEMYRKTLANYKQEFGEGPPLDIWPPAEQLFARSEDELAGPVRRTDPRWLLALAVLVNVALLGIAIASRVALLFPMSIFTTVLIVVVACAIRYNQKRFARYNSRLWDSIWDSSGDAGINFDGTSSQQFGGHGGGHGCGSAGHGGGHGCGGHGGHGGHGCGGGGHRGH